jgi:hypothetical protein
MPFASRSLESPRSQEIAAVRFLQTAVGMAPTNRADTAVLPAILTAIALAIGGAMALIFPLAIVGLYLLTLPVALILLWVGRDVEAPIDRILAADAHRAQRRSVARPEQELSKAA